MFLTLCKVLLKPVTMKRRECVGLNLRTASSFSLKNPLIKPFSLHCIKLKETLLYIRLLCIAVGSTGAKEILLLQKKSWQVITCSARSDHCKAHLPQSPNHLSVKSIHID